MLSLDLLRVLGGDPHAVPVFLDACARRLAAVAKPQAAADPAANPAAAAAEAGAPRRAGSRVWPAMHTELLRRACAAAGEAVRAVEQDLRAAAASVQGSGRGAGLPEAAQAGARDLAFAMTRAFVAGEARCCAGPSCGRYAERVALAC